MQRWSVRGLWGGVLVMMMSACTAGGGAAAPLEEAREEIDALVVELQEAVALDEDLSWEGPTGEALAEDEEGICRWRPGEWTTELALPEDDSGWAEREQRLDAVLQEHGLQALGDPGYTGGSAYGFETAGPAGGVLRIDSWKGVTTIRLHGLEVEVDSDCGESSLTR